MLGGQDGAGLEITEGRRSQSHSAFFGESSSTSGDDRSPKSKILSPYSKGLPVVNLELSNRGFPLVIRKSIKNGNTNSGIHDRCIYPTDHLLAELASRVYSEKRPDSGSDVLREGWTLLTVAKNRTDGYLGAAYWNAEHQQVVIAHQGTNPRSAKDLKADYEGVLSGGYTSQMSSAATFSNNVVVELNKIKKADQVNLSLSFTGHSLGGWLAQITAFTTQYLAPMSFKDKSVFVRSKEEGYHTHTVAFDSPGCKDMLLKMESDLCVRHGDQANLSFLLDITIYLSAPNLVNTLRSHLNIGSLYRVFIKDLPKRGSSWDLAGYTIETHSIEKIRDVFSSEESSDTTNIMRVVDWPLLKEGLGKIILKKLFTPNRNEYERFHEFANCTDSHNTTLGGTEYCTVRYQVKKVRKVECNANIFTRHEFDFLFGCQMLKI